MTLKELKEQVLQMIEEISDTPGVYTDDPDLSAKLDGVINQVMYEVARMKKIPARATKEIVSEVTNDDGTTTEIPLELDLTSLEGFYQLERLVYTDADKNELDYTLFGNVAEFDEEGTAKIYYWKYPTRIVQEEDEVEYDEDGNEISRTTYDEKYKFELSDDALEVLPYGVAADLLKSDVSAKYGEVYANRYEQMLQRLDNRYTLPTIYFGESVDEMSDIL